MFTADSKLFKEHIRTENQNLHYKVHCSFPKTPATKTEIVTLMNDFPVIGHLVMRTGLWDRQGANIASRYKEMYGVELFLR